MTAPIRVVVVDDHPVFRLGMTALVSTFDGVECAGEAADIDEALRVIEELRPDVVLMDLHFQHRSGIEATRIVTARQPEVGVLVVTTLDDDDSLFAALRAGARGYLLKEAGPAEVERAIRSVAHGGLMFGAAIAAQAAGLLTGAHGGPAAPFPQLTDREREVLHLVALGLENAAVAHRLGLSPKTVRNNLSNILVKIQANSRGEAIARARAEGLGKP
ncbi:DNA-binding NarL/FixJ family response regulator [Allocatelliglobosispora scoriae]|uniref:DNA-binding NarL/FixJ family response regulator n=1 Tax=Allocatelliglobosispora scoriae TaxID=643052 RepID=A0A841C239_9ACTN|nr:response regulator transcription factor [Allocatelliglobosispora scoriae]MBB5874414.1 DNA-binding NarL/FixJ family response regulator [Allocatelliglobosispora scoriae]